MAAQAAASAADDPLMRCDDSEQPLALAALNLLLDVTALVENNECPEVPNPDLAELKVTLTAARLKLNSYRSSSFGYALDICLQSVREALSLLKASLTTFDSLATGHFKAASSIDQSAAASSSSSTSETVVLKRSTDGLPLQVHVSPRQECVIGIYRADFFLKLALDQLEALFPLADRSGGAVDPQDLIHDAQGAGFWTTSFGKKLLIPRTRFFKAFQSYISHALHDEADEVLYFVDFFHDDYVTPFEFNCFLDWFGPMVGSIERLLALLKQGVLAGFIPAVEAACLLAGHPPGTFLVRFSKTHVGAFALTYVNSRGKIKHSLLQTDKGSVLLEAQRFAGLAAFVEAHKHLLKLPRNHFDGLRMKIAKKQSADAVAKPAPAQSADELAGSPLSQCVICLELPVQTVFLECGHLACCKECAKPLKLCPVCRGTIVRVLPIFPC